MEIPSLGTCSLMVRQSKWKVTYDCEGVFEESKDGHWDGKGSSFLFYKTIPINTSLQRLQKNYNRGGAAKSPAMQLLHSAILQSNIMFELYCGSTTALPFYISLLHANRHSTITHIHKTVLFLSVAPVFSFSCVKLLQWYSHLHWKAKDLSLNTSVLSCLMGCNFSGWGSRTFPFHCNTQETSLSGMCISHTFSNFYLEKI